MKKNIQRFMVAPMIVSTLAITSFLALRPTTKVEPVTKNAVSATKSSPNNCGSMCSAILTDCFGGPGCTLPGCSGVWKVPNFSPASYTPVNHANITFSVCFNGTGTPPWTSYTLVGKIMNPGFVPPATQTFNCSTGTGTIFKCTVTNTGYFYMQHFSGPLPTGLGTTLTGQYGIKCGHPCNS